MPRPRRPRRRTSHTDSMSGAVHGLLALALMGGAAAIVWYMIGDAQKGDPSSAVKPTAPRQAPRQQGKPARSAPARNGTIRRPAAAPVERGPHISELVNDLNVAILSREVAKYRGDRSGERRHDRMATEARRAVEEAVSRGAEATVHLEPLDKILTVDDSDLRTTSKENASEILDRTLTKVGKDEFVKFKVERFGAEKDLYVFFPMVRKARRAAASGSKRIRIESDFALQIQHEVLSQPLEILGLKERKKIEEILSRGEATEEEYAYLTRRVTMRSASTAAEERKQFAQQIANLERALDKAPVQGAVVKHDGKRVKGLIVTTDGKGVTIDTALGTTVTIPRAEIRFERSAAQLRQEFRGRMASASEFTDALPQLLVWTREWEMPTHREYVAFQMLVRNPNNRVARLAAGYHQSPDGAWVLGERRPTAKRPDTKAELKPELVNMGFLFRDGKWYAQSDWSVGIDNLHSRPNYPLGLRGVKIWAWHLDDTPQSRIIDGSGKKGKRTYKGSPRLRFLAPTGTNGTASITVEAPAEIISCQVKAPGEIIARGAAGAKIEVYVTAAGGTSTPIYSLEQARNETFYDISYQVRGKRKFTITANMVTVKDDYHTYARWLPCLPETKEAFWVRAKILKPAPEIDTIWRNAK